MSTISLYSKRFFKEKGGMNMDEIWKVFAPHDLFSQSDAYLFGHITIINRSVYIAASHQNPTLKIPGLELIGLWSKEKKHEAGKSRNTKQGHWTCVWQDENGDTCCEVSDCGQTKQCTFLIYNPSELVQSEILKQKVDDSKNDDNITSLVRTLHNTNLCLGEYEIRDKVTDEVRVYTRVQRQSRISRYVMMCVMFLESLMYLPFTLFAVDAPRSVRKVVSVSATLAQLACRNKELNRARLADELKPFRRLRCVNTCLKQVIDTWLGLMLMYYLMEDNKSQYFANICLSYGDKVAGELKVLLDWLMGAPAGLKLNSQLTHILGRFFQYHIYLWSGYLYILKPVLGHLVYYGSIAGVWGLSVQLALFQDILSTMTIHIYCFYVYAARLYRLQMYAMASLWRLFRGKKWNVLRQRVDSAVYDADQLFVGTLLFTVLLFILPTTGLYYVVFTLLRVIVLSVQGVVSRTRQILNCLPWWLILLWVVKSASLTDGAVFEVVSYLGKSPTVPLVLSIKATRPNLPELMCLTSKPVVTTSKYSWGTIVQNLFLGHLIYPWIERKKFV